MFARKAVDQVEKIIRDAAEHLRLPDSDPQIDEIITSLGNALAQKENALPPSGSS